MKTRDDIVDQLRRYQRDYDRSEAQLDLLHRQQDEARATLMLLAQERFFMIGEAARLSEELERLPEQDQKLRHVRHAVVESAVEYDQLCVDIDAQLSAAGVAMGEISQRERALVGEVGALRGMRADVTKNILDSLAALQQQLVEDEGNAADTP
ncbi:unnamed protein product [Peniophora sp. CBMAI 1063]|nr:unnamed protein product [Peniophora sp. CBMAI 1063]